MSAGRAGRLMAWTFLVVGLVVLTAVAGLLRLGVATDFLYHAAVKDPARTAPAGQVIVAPADGTVLYVRRVEGGVVPQVVKRGVPVPVADHLKDGPKPPFGNGWLIGIFMNTHGVHVNRVPIDGVVRHRAVWNGPHMEMTAAETAVILRAMLPGAVTARRLIGLEPFDIEDKADFVLESARETLQIDDVRGARVWVVRIADYWVGKILTWVDEGESVACGQKLGLITWGSQTDLFIEDSPGLAIRARVGDYVYGAETVLAEW